ncbi:hypothetical protein OIHEL45_17071 [Sulfitobacter indolifex HEL-45]|uniref:Uncharacterized protein n=1 Tax=Sulfitobacter indolifex HEL-45 TaxID=391624 RepID=A0ABM9X0J3_9RHOB|nr:hypothetical protein OIHEL45_17071 [Sulfitobacter indolifex HEL-45]
MAQALGWKHLVPLMAAGLKRLDLRKRGDDLAKACHRAVVASAVEAVRLAADLARRAAQLKAVAPKLRAKGAAKAVEMFLRHDAVAPAALPLPDRAARGLCDRLVDLGAVRELTDAAELLIRSDLTEQVGKHRRIANAAARDFDRAYLQRLLINPYVDIAP